MYGKQTERAIAAMSRLAEVWDGGKTRLSAIDIAEQRGLPRAMVAKLLTALSQAGLVSGSPGPGGGYSLARRPDQIAFQDVYEIFERQDRSSMCPFGGGVCGVGEPCALHDKLVAMEGSVRSWLQTTTFEIFREATQDRGLKPTARDVAPPSTPRQSFRASKPRGS
ncbi:MAG: Rrf2 family transcriptional regulator [Phycisphaerae bacterium]|nr:Rrf2 family transcriptional regulator [Phycisphaerae bacterium]